jgi:hypothetical protein
VAGGVVPVHKRIAVASFVSIIAAAGLTLPAGCRSAGPSDSSKRNGKVSSDADCTATENPYDEDSGHYAGYEWAQENGSGTCIGKSEHLTRAARSTRVKELHIRNAKPSETRPLEELHDFATVMQIEFLTTSNPESKILCSRSSEYPDSFGTSDRRY